MVEIATKTEADKEVVPVEKAETTEVATLTDLVLNNRKRTFKMFAGDVDVPLVEDPLLVKMKV